MSQSRQLAIDCRELGVSQGDTEILREVNLQVGLGETVALLGGNGSGKTTTIRAILGLTPLSHGSVTLFGEPLARLTDWQRIGYVPQRAELSVPNATVRELVSTGRLAHRGFFRPPSAADRTAIAEALEAVGLTGRARQQVATLSGGQRQRTQIARALSGGPELMLLDEPLAGLDVPSQGHLAGILAGLKARGLSLLIVLHDLGPLEGLIDRSVVLQSGRVIYDGPLAAGTGAEHVSHAHLLAGPHPLLAPVYPPRMEKAENA